MIIAIIENNVVVNLIICDTIKLAQELLPDAVCIDGEGLVIGDAYED